MAACLVEMSADKMALMMADEMAACLVEMKADLMALNWVALTVAWTVYLMVGY
jgi:hypothetical protein